MCVFVYTPHLLYPFFIHSSGHLLRLTPYLSCYKYYSAAINMHVSAAFGVIVYILPL